MKRKIAAIICAAAMVVPLISINAEYTDSDIKKAVTNAVNWKNEYDNPFYSIGSDSSNLYITALSRLGENYDYDSYLHGLDGVTAAYGAEHQASVMQRAALAVIASGGDAQNVGGRDLIADSTFYRDSTAHLGKDGAGDYAWALIALDSGNFETPDWSIMNRDEIIAALLSAQDGDGSFSGDIYTTASAITALAPYIETSGAYTITQNQTGFTFDISPREAVDNALAYLSATQMKDGDWGNLDATAMANIALDSVGIDSEKDTNFVARNGSAFDGLMSYKNNDGGFAYDAKKSDGEATSYALCALVSHLAHKQGKSGIFRVKATDKITLVSPTATPSATQAPQTNNSTGSNTNTNTSSNASSGNASQSRATTRPVSTPRATTVPRTTTGPVNTMRPTRTAAPLPSTSPSASLGPTSTPHPTKRPALVGPVEMPGPMPTASPDAINGAGSGDTENSGAGVIIAVAGGVLLLLLAAAAAWLLIRKQNKTSSNAPVRKTPQTSNENNSYHSKQHRKTEEHMRFNKREKYKKRLKFKHKK